MMEASAVGRRREKGRKYARTYRAAHPEKVRAAGAKYYAANRGKAVEKVRKWRLKCVYGLTIEQREQIFTLQGNCCAVCRAVDPGPRGWQTDHCHDTGNVRGILCVGCNLGLGKFKDNSETLRLAADYLERPPAIPVTQQKEGPRK
jgi:DNA-binding sugar fermentation-stimulating protein